MLVPSLKLAVQNNACPRNLASLKYALRWNLVPEKSTPPLNLIPKKYTFPKNCEPENYTGFVNSLLTIKSERLKSAR